MPLFLGLFWFYSHVCNSISYSYCCPSLASLTSWNCCMVLSFVRSDLLLYMWAYILVCIGISIPAHSSSILAMGISFNVFCFYWWSLEVSTVYSYAFSIYTIKLYESSKGSCVIEVVFIVQFWSTNCYIQLFKWLPDSSTLLPATTICFGPIFGNMIPQFSRMSRVIPRN